MIIEKEGKAEELRAAFHYLFPEELLLLQRLARDIPTSPAVVLNIGAGAGTSGVGFAEARSDLILHTVDITDDSHPRGCLQSERDWMHKAGLTGKWGKTWFQYHMKSSDLALNWKKATGNSLIDLLFIDGDHEYEGRCADISGFMPYVRPSGIIAIHDYDKPSISDYSEGPSPKDLPGVTLAVDDLMPIFAKHIETVQTTIVYRKYDQ